MDDLPFDNNDFGIIWSEDAIYNVGFEAGVKYWIQEYPEIDKSSNKIKFLEDNGLYSQAISI